MSRKISFISVSFVAITCLSGFLTSCSKSTDPAPAPPQQLLPQGGTETLPTDASNDNSHVRSTEEKQLQPILDTGKRAVTWLNLVNQNRNEQTRLNLADRSTTFPVPPEKPKVNSVKLMLEKYNDRLNTMPALMKPYILEGQALVEIPPVSDEAFIKSIREINGLYQNAIRLIGQVQYFGYYAEQDVRDIRGYYFFMKEPAAVTALADFQNLSADLQTKYSEWLIGMCHNSDIDKSDCENELKNNIKKLKVSNFYKKYYSQAKATYDNYFQVRKMRSDLKWNASGSELTQDFILPSLQKISAWLKTNVEEEWKANGFQLFINFVPQNPVSPFLTFEKGVTPHVSGNTWNSITMDPDYSLDDYDTQWTIRHEFGHVLGFRDCYLEFYDQTNEQMVYYTIEPDNLMCAWGGKLQPSHIEELKRVYQ